MTCHSVDMISLLGKRPFAGRNDDMDNWLDEHQHGSAQRSAPPPFERPVDPEPTPTPGVATSTFDEKKL